MRTIQVGSGFYKIKVGVTSYRVYASDLKMISKRRKNKTPPVPMYYEDDELIGSIQRKSSSTT